MRLAIVGNLIDYGPPGAPADTAALRAAVDNALQRPLAFNHLELFRNRLADAEHVLYLADNSGETVFDRVLIETLARPTTYVVKGAPVLNDATFEDALAAGLDRVRGSLIMAAMRRGRSWRSAQRQSARSLMRPK